MTALKRKGEDKDIGPPLKRRKIIVKPKSILELEKIYCIELTSGETGKKLGTFELPCTATAFQLNNLVNEIQKDLPDSTGRNVFTFHLDSKEILQNVQKTALEEANETRKATSTKDAPLQIVFFKQSIFKVRPVTRCSDTLHGHTESILCLEFSPDGNRLVTGGGDRTLRLWDLTTATPIRTLKGHENHVLVVKWSPDGKLLASGDRNGIVKIWDGMTGKKKSKNLRNHKKWITGISWEPYHLNKGKCIRFVSCSKDCSLKVWNSIFSRCEVSLTGHTKGITCCVWNGDGFVYTGSQDCTIQVWDVGKKCLVKALIGHSHWINTMSLSSEYVLRRGPFDENCNLLADQPSECLRLAKQRFDQHAKITPLRIVTGSDDNTIGLWAPGQSDRPIKRLTSHLQLVNDVKFSPDGKYIASASFDKSVIIWNSESGKVKAKLRGHVGAVYKLAWSGDSRLVASSSKDSTCKVWNVQFSKLLYDLPGHFDEVYAVDWSPDGQRVASAGKDRTLKIWKH